MKSFIFKSVVAATVLAVSSFGGNLVLNPSFEIQGATPEEAQDWFSGFGDTFRANWASRTLGQGMVIASWGGGTPIGDFFQVISTNIPGGSSLMFEFHAKKGATAQFDSGAEFYSRIDLMDGASIVETFTNQVLSRLITEVWISFNQIIENTNDNIDGVSVEIGVSGLTNDVIMIDDVALAFLPLGFEDPGFEEAGILWNKTNDCSVEGWANRSGNYGLAFHGWINNGSAGISQEIITNCSPDGGGYPIISFSIWALPEDNYYSTSGDTKIGLELSSNSVTTVENNIHTALTNARNTWVKYTVTYDNESNNINKIKPFVSASNFAAPGGSQALKIDDTELTITWIPEPVIFLPAVILLGVIRPMRKKNLQINFRKN